MRGEAGAATITGAREGGGAPPPGATPAPIGYRLVAGFARFLVRLYFPRLRVVGAERLPRSGGLLIVCNHIDLADPGILLAVLPRRLVFLAMKQVFGWPLVGLLVRMTGALPVTRGGATIETMRRALRALREGAAVIIFPEGERDHGALKRGMPGAALLALRAGRPVVPVAITGTEHVRWPWVLLLPLLGPRVTVTVGEPFELPRPAGPAPLVAQDAIDAIMRRIADLLPERYRGVYAGAGG